MKKLFSMLLLVCIVIPLQIQAISMEAIKNDIIKVITKYMDIDSEGLDIQITQTESEGGNGSVPVLCANIPVRDMKKRS